MSETSFEQLMASHGFRTQTTARIIPPRVKTSGPRTGGGLSDAARSAGDRFYFAATPLAKFIYSKIEERFSGMPADIAPGTRKKLLDRREKLLAEAKSILNQHRNQIVEAVLPLFDVAFRHKDTLADDEPLPEADQHAHDYFVKNVYTMLCREFTAWLPEFVSEDQFAAAQETLKRLAIVHRERLESELRNFRFGFRKVITPR